MRVRASNGPAARAPAQKLAQVRLGMMRVHGPDIEQLRAIAHPVRVQILWMVREERQYVCHLNAVLELRQSHVSHHLARLRGAKLVVSHQEGQLVSYSLRQRELAKVLSDLCQLVSPDCRACLVPPAPWWLCRCPRCTDTRLQAGLDVDPVGSYGVVGSIEVDECAHSACVRTCRVPRQRVLYSMASDCTRVQEWAAELRLADIDSTKGSAMLGPELSRSAGRHLCSADCPVAHLVLEAAAVAGGRVNAGSNWSKCGAGVT